MSCSRMARGIVEFKCMASIVRQIKNNGMSEMWHRTDSIVSKSIPTSKQKRMSIQNNVIEELEKIPHFAAFCVASTPIMLSQR